MKRRAIFGASRWDFGNGFIRVDSCSFVVGVRSDLDQSLLTSAATVGIEDEDENEDEDDFIPGGG